MIRYTRNLKELVWYQELIYKDDEFIGEIFTNIEGDGYLLKKARNIIVDDSTPMYITETVAQFETVCDAKDFVNQANGI